jgi:two-component sensor histidine kinase
MLRFLILLFFISSLFLQAKVTITHEMQEIEDFELEYYYDKNKTQTIETIQDIKFQKKTSNFFSFGFVSGNSWFKLTITNKSEAEQFVFQLVEPFFQRVYFYIPEDNTWTVEKSGLKFYEKEKNKKYLAPIFTFKVEQNTTKTLYLQFAPDAENGGSSFGRLTLASQSRFNSITLLGYYLFYFFFFGTMSILIIFYLFLFIKFKDVLYFYYASYMFFVSLYASIYSGLIHHFGFALWYRELSLSIPLFLIFLILFSSNFLKLKFYLPKIHQLLNFIVLLFTISMPYMLYDYTQWMRLFAMLWFLVALILGFATIYVVYKGHKEAKLYLIGILFHIIALSVLPLMAHAILPNSAFAHYAFSIFSYVEILFFSFVLIGRFYRTQNDKIRLQGELLEVQKNTEKTLEHKVTQRTNTVNQLLAEKEVLLKEVYHRVKNNFHMVTSLLWIEYENQKNETQKSTLLELMNRIKSMALIHQYLLGMNDYSQINASEYLTRIVKEIEKSYSLDLLHIRCEIDDFTLSPDDALSLGIIINELLTNSIKHHQRHTTCSIEMSCIHKDHEIILSVQDNGQGFDIEASHDSFGLQLIEEFSDRLHNSQQTFSFEKGTKFEMCFTLV